MHNSRSDPTLEPDKYVSYNSVTDMDGMFIARRLIAEECEKKTGYLDLGNLILTEIPIELFKLSHLRGLNLGSGYYVDEHGEYYPSSNCSKDNSNRLRELPSIFSDLGNLLTLFFANNPISDFGPPGERTVVACLRPPVTLPVEIPCPGRSVQIRAGPHGASLFSAARGGLAPQRVGDLPIAGTLAHNLVHVEPFLLAQLTIMVHRAIPSVTCVCDLRNSIPSNRTHKIALIV